MKTCAFLIYKISKFRFSKIANEQVMVTVWRSIYGINIKAFSGLVKQ